MTKEESGTDAAEAATAGAPHWGRCKCQLCLPDPRIGMTEAEVEAYYDSIYPWRVKKRKCRERREARRAFMAQNSLWLAEYEDWLERVRNRKRNKTTHYLRGRTGVAHGV